jgi:hypothetical protein
MVEPLINEYQYGHFDGMIDCYEYSNNRNDIPQVKFVFANREYSDEIVYSTAVAAKNHYADLENVELNKDNMCKSFDFLNQWFNWHQIAYRILSSIDLTNKDKIISDPNFESGLMFEGFKAVTIDELYTDADGFDSPCEVEQ